MNIEKYLNRINYSGELKPNLDLLKKLQKAHLLNVPFENLDIHTQNPIELNIDKIYKKIIENNRGGFCYELNGLFYELLILLNFNAKRISARVYNKTKEYSPEFDHFAIIVKIDGNEYLTDVGFGEFTFGPLKLDLGKMQNDQRGEYLIDKYDDMYFRVNRISNGESTPEYIFRNIKREFRDYKKMCEYHQTNPNSHFIKKRLITRPTENGRITIAGNTLKIKENDSLKERTLTNEIEFERELWNLFKIKMPKPVTNKELD